MNKEAVLNNIQLAQQGDETAKELIVKNSLQVILVSFPYKDW